LKAPVIHAGDEKRSLFGVEGSDISTLCHSFKFTSSTSLGQDQLLIATLARIEQEELRRCKNDA
jgi:hypothetical protein